MFENISVNAIGIILATAGSVWSLAWWLNGHFNNLRKDFIALGKEIIDKLEYHERHDDKRFAEIRDDIWDIRVRNAAFDKIILPNRKEHE
jgi:hypothetical protein